MKALSTITALLIFGFFQLQAQTFSLSIDGSYSRHTIDFAGIAPQDGFNPALGFDARFDLTERSAIHTGVNFAPILLRQDQELFDLNMVAIGEVSIATRINSFAIPISYVHKLNKLSLGVGYQLNPVHSSKSTITGLADLNMDGTLEPFESEESPGLLDSFYHGFIGTVLYEYIPGATIIMIVYIISSLIATLYFNFGERRYTTVEAG